MTPYLLPRIYATISAFAVLFTVPEQYALVSVAVLGGLLAIIRAIEESAK